MKLTITELYLLLLDSFLITLHLSLYTQAKVNFIVMRHVILFIQQAFTESLSCARNDAKGCGENEVEVTTALLKELTYLSWTLSRFFTTRTSGLERSCAHALSAASLGD